MTSIALYSAPMTGLELAEYHALDERGFPCCRSDNPPPVYAVSRVNRIPLPLVSVSRRCTAPGCREQW